MTIKITNQGLQLLKLLEGLYLNPYEDSGGILTIGYGHVIRDSEMTTLKRQITYETADYLLQNDVAKVEAQLEQVIGSIPLTADQIDALIIFVFNIGIGNFKISSVYKNLKEGKIVEAANFFKSFVKAGGVRVFGLVKRRAVEKLLYQGKNYGYTFIFQQRVLDAYSVLGLEKEV